MNILDLILEEYGSTLENGDPLIPKSKRQEVSSLSINVAKTRRILLFLCLCGCVCSLPPKRFIIYSLILTK